MRTIPGTHVSNEGWEAACKAGAMERTAACRTDDKWHHCRSDVWMGDLLSFAHKLGELQYREHCLPGPADDRGYAPDYESLLCWMSTNEIRLTDELRDGVCNRVVLWPRGELFACDYRVMKIGEALTHAMRAWDILRCAPEELDAL